MFRIIRSTLVGCLLLIGVSGCEGPVETPPAAEALVPSVRPLTAQQCSPTMLSGSTCRGPWRYHATLSGACPACTGICSNCVSPSSVITAQSTATHSLYAYECTNSTCNDSSYYYRLYACDFHCTMDEIALEDDCSVWEQSDVTAAQKAGRVITGSSSSLDPTDVAVLPEYYYSFTDRPASYVRCYTSVSYKQCTTCSYGDKSGFTGAGLSSSAATTEIRNSTVYEEAIDGLSCVTDDDVPAADAAAGRAKFQRIRDAWTKKDFPAQYASIIEAAMVRDLEILYELWGSTFDPAMTEAALDVIRAYPSSTPACASKYATDPGCAPSADVTRDLEFCSRLVAPNVTAQLVEKYYDVCVNMVVRMAAQADGWTCSPAAGFARGYYVTDAVALFDALLDKLLTADKFYVNGATPNDVTLGTQLSYVDKWLHAFEALRATTTGANQLRDLGQKLLTVSAKFWKQARVASGTYDKSAVASNLAQAQTLLAADPSSTAARDLVRAALKSVVGDSVELDRKVLDGLFRAQTSTAPAAVTGRALALFTGQALVALATRLDNLGLYHDLACSLTTCSPNDPARDTDYVRFWRLLGAADSAVDLRSALDLTPATDGALKGWRATFSRIYDGHARLAPEILAGNSVGSSPGQVIESAAIYEPLVTSVAKAKVRYGAYLKSGRFNRADEFVLRTSVHATARQDVKQFVDDNTAELDAAYRDYRQNMYTLLDALVRSTDNTGAIAQTQARKERLVAELDDLNERKAANVRAEDQDTTFDTLAAGYSAITDAQGDRYFATLEFAPAFVDASDARYSGGYRGDVEPLAIRRTTGTTPLPGAIAVQGGQMLVVSTEGVWSPTCALSDPGLTLYTGDGLSTQPISAAGAKAGPEGFVLVDTGSAFHLNSATSTSSDSVSLGVQAQVCGGTAGVGYSATACAYARYDHTWTWSDSSTDTTQATQSVAFSKGLRVRTTPFPNAPAGSLLAVEIPIGVAQTFAQVTNVHLVRGPNTVIPVERSSNLYLVVNDTMRSGCTPDTSDHLTVRVSVLQDLHTSAQDLGMRMQCVLQHMRSPSVVQPYLDAGEITPTQAAGLRTEAEMQLMLGCAYYGTTNPRPLSEYPAELARLFQAFVDREIGHLERRVRIRNLDKEIRAGQMELVALRATEGTALSSGIVYETLAQRAVASLDLDFVRVEGKRLSANILDYLLPVLRLWYPQVLAQTPECHPELGEVCLADAISQLQNLGVESDLSDVTSAVVGVGKQLSRAYGTADLSRVGRNVRTVVVSIPRPDGPAADPGANLDFLMVDPVVAERVWAEIDQRKTVDVPIVIEDVFGPSSPYLGCYKELPVLRFADIVLVHDYDRTAQNTRGRWVRGSYGIQQTFATTAGPVHFNLVNPVLRNKEEVYLYYGTQYAEFDTLTLIDNKDRQRLDVLGLSPFGDLELHFEDFVGLQDGYDRYVDYGFGDALSLLLVLQIEVTDTGAPLTWARRCASFR